MAGEDTQTRIAAPDRRREGTYLGKKINGVRVCLECDTELKPRVGCERGGRPLRCDPCGTARYWALVERRALAASAVKREVKEGRLPRPSTLVCVDCGRPAEQYDHRDYSKPLQVDPVCRSCNVLRGPAPYPPLPTTESQAA